MKKIMIGMLACTMMLASCKKDNTTQDSVFGTVTDIDGNTYQTVKIGTQTWMMENLKTTRYNDGTIIPNITDNLQWYNLGTGAYCFYDNDSTNNATYGKLYNWFSVNTGKLAPTGWHVPTLAEYNTLVQFLGNGNDVGGKLKSTSSLWVTPNTGANNSTNFTALPAGFRNGSGGNSVYANIGKVADFWLSDSNGPFYFNVGNNTADIYQGYMSYKNSGYSIRCIKD